MLGRRVLFGLAREPLSVIIYLGRSLLNVMLPYQAFVECGGTQSQISVLSLILIGKNHFIPIHKLIFSAAFGGIDFVLDVIRFNFAIIML